MNRTMKTFLVWSLIQLPITTLLGQTLCDPTIDPSFHDLNQPSGGWRSYHTLAATHHDYTDYIEEDLCSYDGYMLVFDDEFDGNTINREFWGNDDEPAWGADKTTYAAPFGDPSCYEGGGMLNINCIRNGNGTANNPVPSNLYYRSGQLISNQSFPSGRVEVRAKISGLPNDQSFDVAPLWLWTKTPVNTIDDVHYQCYTEIDVELMNANIRRGTYTLHATPNYDYTAHWLDDGAGLECNNDINLPDGNWHKYRIDWDMYTIQWYVDDQLVNALYRTYNITSLGIIPVPTSLYGLLECNGAPVDGEYARDNMFPLYANMHFLIGAGGTGTYENPNITLNVDYIKFWRKITCDKTVDLHEYKTAGASVGGGVTSQYLQLPPTIDHETPSVITGGTINIAGSSGDNFIFRRNTYDSWIQHDLNLKATQEVNLLPGFETFITNANGDAFSADIVSCPMAKTESPPPSSQPVVVKPVASVADFAVGLYPNPATSQCTVRFSIPDGADVTITLIDMMGRDIGTIDHSWHTQGTSFVPFSTEGYAPGVYTVRFTDGTHTSTQRLTISGR